MPGHRSHALLLSALMLAAPVAGLAHAANWEPGAGAWPMFRQGPSHAGLSPSPAAFPAASAGDVRVKWSHAGELPFWLPPVAADMDNDGVAEVVASMGNVEVAPGPPPTVEFTSGFEVLDGATGELEWAYGPNAGNLIWFAPALGDLDADGDAEMVFFDGAPLTGNFGTNKLMAYSHAGQKLWEYSDPEWGARVPNAISAPLVADVDGEATRREAVVLVLLATVTTTVENNVLVVHADDPGFEVHAVNGEGAGQRSWRLQHEHGSVSSPAVADLDGDGRGDLVYGSGMRRGVLLDLGSARVSLSDDFEDTRTFAYRGGASPSQLWSHDSAPVEAGEIGTAPALADVNGDGRPDAVLALSRRGDSVPRTNLTVVLHNGSVLFKTLVLAGVSRPPAIGDLDGDGKPNIVVQTEGGSEGNRLLAFRENGQLLWRTPPQPVYMNGVPAIGDLTGDGKPEVATLHGARTTSPTRLVVFNGQTGALMWQKDIDADDTLGGPVLADVDGDDDGRPEILVNIGAFADSPNLRHSLVVCLEPELPDLQVTNLAFSASQHVVGEAETITARVANVGSRTASQAVVRVLDGSEVVQEQVVTLAPGAHLDLSAPWTPAHGGARTVRVVADPGKAIPEWAENQNEQARSLFVRSADLAFAAGDPTFSDPNPGVGDTVLVGATLRNLGGKDAANVVVRFLDDGAAFGEVVVGMLPSGGQASVTAALNVQGERNHRIEVLADPAGAIAEEDEGNNAASRLLNVRFLAPDLALEAGDVALEDPNPDELDELVARVTVRNQGSPGKDARDVVVRLLDRGQAAAEAVLPLVASGGSAQAELRYLIQDVGKRDLAVLLDPDDAIVELDDANNAASRTVVVGKVRATVAMERPAFGLQETASGVAQLAFRNTGRPLAGHELGLPVEYVLAPGSLGSPGLGSAVEAAAALVAAVNADTAQHLRVCAAGRCLDATVEQALETARLVGGGAGGAPEFRWRLFTLEATTDRFGLAEFEVPMALAGALQSLAGETAAQGCLEGFPEVDALLAQAGQPPLACLGAGASVPPLPGASNLPGRHRASAVVDWHGFGFHGGADYAHAP